MLAIRTLIVAGVLAVCLKHPAAADSAGLPAHRYDRIIAVPVPAGKTVTLDGDLGEWDLTGAIDTCYDPALEPRFTAVFALMYDDQALYFSAQVADETPLMNARDPQVEPQLGWSGDCLQLRLCSDPTQKLPLAAGNYVGGTGGLRTSDRIVHLTMWHYTGRKEAVLQLSYGMDYHGSKLLRGKEASVAFRPSADGRGYTVEARFPWSMLNATANPPKAGDSVAMTLQPLWGNADGTKNVMHYYELLNTMGFPYQSAAVWGTAEFSRTGNLPRNRRSLTREEALTPLRMTVDLPDAEAKQVSIGLTDAAGVLVRSLPVMVNPQAGGGKVEIAWDGLDDLGQPLPAGPYTARVLTHRGVTYRYVTSLHNAGTPPWKNDDGTGSWGGDHGSPCAAGSDGQRVYLGWQFSEAGNAVIAVDLDLPGDRTVATKAKKVWGQHNVLDLGIVTRAIVSNGQYVFVGQDGSPYKRGKTNIAGVVLWEAATGRPANFPFNKRVLELSAWTPEQFADTPQDSEGKLNLADLVVRGDLLYASLTKENKVVAVNWKTGEAAANWAVPSPRGMAEGLGASLLVISGKQVLQLDTGSGQTRPVVTDLTDPRDVACDAAGMIYVTDGGVASQVKVFSAAGKPVRTIGKAGGRPGIGRYDPAGMYNPTGVTVDAQQRVWVTETDNSPRRVSVWSASDGTLLADLLGPGDYAVMSAADLLKPQWVNTHQTLFDVDYGTGQWKTLATLIRRDPAGPQFLTDGQGRHLTFRHLPQGIFFSSAGRGLTNLYRLDERTLAGIPVAVLGGTWGKAIGSLEPEAFPESERAEIARIWSADKGRNREKLVWCDLNGDHFVQLAELQVGKPDTGVPSIYWGDWVDERLSIWTVTMYNQCYVYRVDVERWTDQKVPVYPAPAQWKPLFKSQARTVSSVMPAGDGQGVYLIEGYGSDAGRGGDGGAISRYTLDGRLQWAYRPTWTEFGLVAPLFRPGDVIGAMKFIGSAKLDSGLEIVGVNGYFGQFNLLAQDGQWVAAIGKDNRYGPKADEMTVWPENFSGFFFRNKDDGRFYLFAGDTDARIWQVQGLDAIKTAQASVALSAEDAELARSVAAQRGQRTKDATPLPVVKLTQPKLDGDLAGWPMDQARSLDAGAGRAAKIVLGYDDQNLYAAFDVRDDSPLANKGGDPALLFKTGDSVNLYLAASPDLRLLVTLDQDKPVVVLYQPKAPQGVAPSPRTFSSPTGSETFERVVTLDSARVGWRRSATGYTVTLAVPQRELGLTVKQGQTLRGDAGVLFSDPGGSLTVRRAMLFNADTQITNDIPTEVRFQPDQWGVLEIR